MRASAVSQALQAQVPACFFFNDPATTETYPLSLHDALPIWSGDASRGGGPPAELTRPIGMSSQVTDRKSTRLNSSHRCISYAAFCLTKMDQDLCAADYKNEVRWRRQPVRGAKATSNQYSRFF